VKKKKELRKELEMCQKQKAEYLAGWQRERAEFLNYKKEEMERIKEILKYGGEEIILKILPILDNFEIAEKKLPEDFKKNENIKGILQIKNQILDFLKNQGVEIIETLGKKFDPSFQEAVEEIEKKGVESGIVIEEIQKGYKLHGKVIRPAKVKVAK
jgi:molecular chaperone GrpE